ncbi:uncharacterized protein F4822DRAFT_288288 [Hypoxylon trugodes]|uniref:uncharacterized protein n=1 Tax=Hypoxylon trugodes TaxID=326681 RepID=UPI00219267FB|nr:uncharacterized protein F4822DRAFT_288288 [Hypoxylon trugodes]KAI1387605.1 hypothetical protein F4822DRAFT_288288 [Hypoxylon trugodes]
MHFLNSFFFFILVIFSFNQYHILTFTDLNTVLTDNTLVSTVLPLRRLGPTAYDDLTKKLTSICQSFTALMTPVMPDRSGPSLLMFFRRRISTN